jgi:hypothetical protein
LYNVVAQDANQIAADILENSNSPQEHQLIATEEAAPADLLCPPVIPEDHISPPNDHRPPPIRKSVKFESENVPEDIDRYTEILKNHFFVALYNVN